MDNDLYWEIPSSIELEKLLQSRPPDFKCKIDHFYYIIDYLWNAMVYHDLDDIGGFINLNAFKLQKQNHDYKKYLEYLMKRDLLRTDMKYVVGKKSFGYRLNFNDSEDLEIIRIPITNWTIKRRRLREQREQQGSMLMTRHAYPFLSKWFNDRLEIDAVGARKEALKLYPVMTGGIKGHVKGKASKCEKRMRTYHIIDRIANKQFFYSVDENVGRFHSNLTNLKKEVRNYITYDGHQLVNVDIKNSQPLFSTLLFNKNFYKTAENQFLNINSIPSIESYLSNPHHSYSSITIMLVKLLKNTDNDIIKYIDYVNSGVFYEKIFSELYPKEPFNKAKAKTMMFTVFFSSNR